MWPMCSVSTCLPSLAGQCSNMMQAENRFAYNPAHPSAKRALTRSSVTPALKRFGLTPGLPGARVPKMGVASAHAAAAEMSLVAKSSAPPAEPGAAGPGSQGVGEEVALAGVEGNVPLGKVDASLLKKRPSCRQEARHGKGESADSSRRARSSSLPKQHACRGMGGLVVNLQAALRPGSARRPIEQLPHPLALQSARVSPLQQQMLPPSGQHMPLCSWQQPPLVQAPCMHSS